ncbi:MAG: DNA-directed RNA polymerase subunit alpha [Acidobacteriota bacterium]|nr:DNA-directed RNA polymerase subunit alpha [Blastocatellia bacterium]MDW8413218.1 DNA-directed RNA polymerase subunit alpha [Acidobacteriota bacterium]
MEVGLIWPEQPRWETVTERYGKVIAEPFFKGFATAVGNSLRRVLLSSIEGTAIAAVRIEGIMHEFSPVPGVVEDATDIILNLKKIAFLMHSAEPRIVTLSVEGPKVVTSDDLQTDHLVEVLSKGVYIATVSEGGRLEVEMMLKRGRRYVPADRNYDGCPTGFIPVDSAYSPIEKVNFQVYPVRVGDNTEDYEGLVLEVWTNGSVDPELSVGIAAKLIKDHMKIFSGENDRIESYLEQEQLPEIKTDDGLDMPIEQLELSVRAYNCLRNADVRTLRELLQKSERELLMTRNFGRKSLNEIKEILSAMGLQLRQEPSS